MSDYLIYNRWMKKLSIPEIIAKTEKRLVKTIHTSFRKLWKLLATAVEWWDLETAFLIQLSFEKMVGTMLNEVQKVYTRWGRKITKDMQLSTKSDYVLSQAIRYVQAKKNVMLWNSSLSITQTTKEHIAEVIIKGLKDWKPYTEIAQDIQNQTEAGILSKPRAQLIAVREVGEAYEEWRLVTINKHLQTTGAMAEKIWDTVNDSKVTEQCRANERKWRILMVDKFPSGDDVAPRNSNPRCRCTTNYRII